jgi:hypothetical protein
MYINTTNIIASYRLFFMNNVLILYLNIVIVSHGATAPSGPGSPHYPGFTITLRHTTVGRTPLDELSFRPT